MDEYYFQFQLFGRRCDLDKKSYNSPFLSKRCASTHTTTNTQTHHHVHNTSLENSSVLQDEAVANRNGFGMTSEDRQRKQIS